MADPGQEKMVVKSIDLLLDDPATAKRFLCDSLFFREDGTELVNGNCRLRLLRRNGHKRYEKLPGTTNVGMEHIALETADIQEVLTYCRRKNIPLDTDAGKPYYNPCVWGTGMYYFNIPTDFGVKIEVAQRLDRTAAPFPTPIFGLEHFGVQVASMEESLLYYRQIGFQQAYPTVEILKEDRILCTMVEAEGFTVELFEFKDAKNCVPFQNEPIYGLSLEHSAGKREQFGPNGERFRFS